MTPYRYAVLTVAVGFVPLAFVSGGVSRLIERLPAPTAFDTARTRIAPNDNRKPAGRLKKGELTVRLVMSRGQWYPEGADGPSVTVEALAEEERPMQIPAPLIRVRTGTIIVATVRNALPDSAITMHGLQTRPGAADDSMRIPPGESRTVRFAAGAPGTYLYTATLGRESRRGEHERETTGGAFVVDSVNARTDDRIFVINIWGDSLDSVRYRNALAINGRSWPNTERIAAATGDTVRWRVVNASVRAHPMHLHGFYFEVLGRGRMLKDTNYTVGDRRVVTEELASNTTMRMAWVADRPGNWLLHCHLSFHVVPQSRLQASESTSHDGLAHDAGRHMAGLVVGVEVRSRIGWRAPARTPARTLRLYVQEGRPTGRAKRAMGFVLERGAPPAPDSVEIAGPVIVLTKGEATDITVINHMREPTGVHWHGIELESYSDGVVGWSGKGKRIAPMIMPGGAFQARLSLPTAGTFMYHTHLSDLEQLTSGMYGALLVMEPGQTFDRRTDHVFVLGWDGLGPGRLPDAPAVIVNGDSTPAPTEMAFGKTHRLRLVNIGPAPAGQFVLRRDTKIVEWRARAKDGSDTPAHLATMRPARQFISVGETYDFDFTPAERGEYRLSIELQNGRVVPWQQRIIVR